MMIPPTVPSTMVPAIKHKALHKLDMQRIMHECGRRVG